ncbi:hypothetical protein [Rhodanobacter lindaniclasticus]
MKRPKDAAALAIFELTNSLQPITRAWFVAVNIVLKEYGHANSVRGAVILAARRAKNPIRQSELADAIGVECGGHGQNSRPSRGGWPAGAARP